MQVVGYVFYFSILYQVIRLDIEYFKNELFTCANILDTV